MLLQRPDEASIVNPINQYVIYNAMLIAFNKSVSFSSLCVLTYLCHV